MSSNILRWYGVTYKGNYYVKNTDNIYYPPLTEVQPKIFLFLSDAEAFAKKLNDEESGKDAKKEKEDKKNREEEKKLNELKVQYAGFNNFISLNMYKSNLKMECMKLTRILSEDKVLRIKEILKKLDSTSLNEQSSLFVLNEISDEICELGLE